MRKFSSSSILLVLPKNLPVSGKHVMDCKSYSWMRLYPSRVQGFCLKIKRKSLVWLMLLLGFLVLALIFFFPNSASLMDGHSCSGIESFKIFYIIELVFEIHIIFDYLKFFSQGSWHTEKSLFCLNSEIFCYTSIWTPKFMSKHSSFFRPLFHLGGRKVKMVHHFIHIGK